MLVIEIPALMVRAWREEVLPDLRRVERYLHGRMDAESILDLCESDNMLLWVVLDDDDNYVASIVTQVSDYPKARVITFVAASGKDMKSWLHTASVIIRNYAKKKGCTIWEIWARPAWKRVLSKYSVRELLTVIDGPV